MGLVAPAQLERPVLEAQALDRQPAGHKKALLDNVPLVILTADHAHPAIRDADHSLPLRHQGLVVVDYPPIGDPQKSGRGALQVEDRPNNLIRQAETLYLLQLLFLIEDKVIG